MHLIMAHILKLYGSLAPYSQQGLEKLNDDVTKVYYRGTNHRIKETLEQIILKHNRTEELAQQSCKRSQNDYTTVDYVVNQDTMHANATIGDS